MCECSKVTCICFLPHTKAVLDKYEVRLVRIWRKAIVRAALCWYNSSCRCGSVAQYCGERVSLYLWSLGCR